MAVLEMTSSGLVTLPEEVLKHLGAKPGDEIELELLPNGHAVMHAKEPSETSPS